jgi:phosphoglycolate phosphatase
MAQKNRRGVPSVSVNVLFDLDGTLTDPSEGITRCIKHALIALKQEVPSDSFLASFIGPPLPAVFGTLLNTTDKHLVERAIAAYRDRFESIGIFENRLQPGIAEGLRKLRANGYRLAVVTAKPTVYASRILTHFNIDTFFDGAWGPNLGSRNYNKAMLLRKALKSLPASRDRAVMVGDRADDILAAKINGIRSIAVTWGFGTRLELAASRPHKVVRSVRALLDEVQRWAGASARHKSRRGIPHYAPLRSE